MQGASPLASPRLNLRFAAKPTEFLYLEQCRQPRRGGTGGEELRRLRWSSPPGQVEQVPRGGLPSLSPAYPAVSLLACPLSPRPPSPAGKGETQSLFRRGLRPRHPGTELLAALAEPAKKMPSGGLAPALLALPPLSPAGELSPPRLACAPCRRRPRRGKGREVSQRRGLAGGKGGKLSPL